MTNQEQYEELWKKAKAYDRIMGGWTSFKDKLPEQGKWVLVTVFGTVTMAYRNSEIVEKLSIIMLDPINNQTKAIDPKVYHITHWMPLPEALKESEK